MQLLMIWLVAISSWTVILQELPLPTFRWAMMWVAMHGLFPIASSHALLHFLTTLICSATIILWVVSLSHRCLHLHPRRTTQHRLHQRGIVLLHLLLVLVRTTQTMWWYYSYLALYMQGLLLSHNHCKPMLLLSMLHTSLSILFSEWRGLIPSTTSTWSCMTKTSSKAQASSNCTMIMWISQTVRVASTRCLLSAKVLQSWAGLI